MRPKSSTGRSAENVGPARMLTPQRPSTQQSSQFARNRGRQAGLSARLAPPASLDSKQQPNTSAVNRNMSIDQVMTAIQRRLESGTTGTGSTAYQAFHEFDRYGDGKIDKKEIGLYLHKLGIQLSGGQLKEVLERVDLDGEGSVSLTELMQCLMENSQNAVSLQFGQKPITAEVADKILTQRVENSFKHLNDAFLNYDIDRDGKIDAHELHHVCNKAGVVLSHAEINRLMAIIAKENGGAITNGDFLHYFGDGADVFSQNLIHGR